MSLRNYLDDMECRILRNIYSMKREIIQKIETQISNNCINNGEELCDSIVDKLKNYDAKKRDVIENLDSIDIKIQSSYDKENAIYDMMIDSRKSEADVCVLLNQMKDIELNICHMMEDSRKSESDIISMLENIYEHGYNRDSYEIEEHIEDNIKNEARNLIINNKDIQRFEKRTINFAGIEWIIPDIASYMAQLEEIFIDEVYKFNAKHDIPVIYDCGSNVGTSIFYFKYLYPKARVIGFEADPNIFQYLSNNIDKLETVEIYNLAVWNKNGTINFGCQGADGGSIVNDFENTVEVKTTRLKEYLEKEEYVDFLKIDIEGAETEVLTDCKDCLDNVDNIFIEYHSISSEKQTLDEVLKILSENGFRYYIEGLYHKRTAPIVNHPLNFNMDLQVSVWATRN